MIQNRLAHFSKKIKIFQLPTKVGGLNSSQKIKKYKYKCIKNAKRYKKQKLKNYMNTKN